MTSLGRLLNPLSVEPKSPDIRPTQPEEPTFSEVALVSYKRVPKACTQCRREKSRCDRARPCNCCVRKGRPEMCVDGCMACRQGRLSCNDKRPCQSCIQEGRECVDDNPVSTAATRKRHTPPSTPPTLRSIKPNPIHISAPTPIPAQAPTPTPTSEPPLKACIPCQQDGKKCSGGPNCQRCEMRGEKCVLPRAARAVKQRCTQCRKKNKKCDPGRPCAKCVVAKMRCIDTPRKGIGRGLKVKRACAGCRIDKIQCQKERPCAGCKRKKIECTEQGCKGCTKKGKKCNICKEKERVHANASESSDIEGISNSCPPDASRPSDSDEDDTVSSTSSPSSLYSHSGYPFDPPFHNLTSHSLKLTPPKESLLYRLGPSRSPLNSSISDDLYTYTHYPGAHASPLHPMDPPTCSSNTHRDHWHYYMPTLPPFSVGFGSIPSLSIMSCTSNERTQLPSE
ncbi:hypothetical protein K439DRAFT_1154343 [Ramaria rubella]|nr:hypothetical protein K439DRAFT_1154343 [Ramaria rubella]